MRFLLCAVFTSLLVSVTTASADEIFTTSGRISYLTFFGSSGPGSGETIIGADGASAAECLQLGRFTGRIGYPASDATLEEYLAMHAALQRAYVYRKVVTIRYRCVPLSLPEVVGVKLGQPGSPLRR